MRRLALIVLLVLPAACSDDERSGFPVATDSGTSTTDAATSDAGGCFWTDGTVPTVPYRLCNQAEDCVVATQQTDCCGNTRLTGIGKTQVAAFNMCESASRAKFPACGCPSGPPTTDDGKTVTTGTTPRVICTDITAAGGICKTIG